MKKSSETYQKLPHDDDVDVDIDALGTDPDLMLQEKNGGVRLTKDGSNDSYHQLFKNSSVSSGDSDTEEDLMQTSSPDSISITITNSEERGKAPLSPSSQRSAPAASMSMAMGSRSLASAPLQHISKSPRFKSDGVIKLSYTPTHTHNAHTHNAHRNNDIFVPKATAEHALVRDLDSDEEEDDLGRYSFDFNHALGINGTGNNNGYGPKPQAQPQRFSTRVLPPHHNTQWTRRYSRTVMSPARTIFGSIQKARTESRRKRMERLLALDATSESSKLCFYTERCTICLSSYCDLLEVKGFAIALVVIFAYSIIVSNLGDDQVLTKNLMLGLGIPFFIFRFMWRPFSWYVCRRERDKMKNDQYRYNGPIELSDSDGLGLDSVTRSTKTRIPIV